MQPIPGGFVLPVQQGIQEGRRRQEGGRVDGHEGKVWVADAGEGGQKVKRDFYIFCI